jgi:hypothetical protein
MSIQTKEHGYDDVKPPSKCYITEKIESVTDWLNYEDADDIDDIYNIL